MNDSIYIETLKVYTQIGVFDYEQQFQQPLLFTVELFTDLSKVTDDNIDSTISYAEVAEQINHYCQVKAGTKLLETIANGLADHLAAKFSIKELKLQINKPQAIQNVTAVGVKIHRFY